MSANKRDFYEVLGVSKGASGDEIKKAYRKKAMKYHPDKNPGDDSAKKKFQEASDAYDILKDDQKRAAYDRYGHAAFDQGGFGSSQSGFGGGGFSAGGASFSDFFEDIFDNFMGGSQGGRQRGGRPTEIRGSDLRYNLEISLEEAFEGKQQKISFTSTVKCEPCSGNGSADGKPPVNCTMCGGSGKINIQQGIFTIQKTCTTCHGAGQVVQNPCRSCSGEGRVKKERNLSVNIPEGVEEGTRIRLAGEGEVGVRGGSSGDLYIFISIADHSFFIRDGYDIHCNVPIKLTSAALGGEIEVPLIEGSRSLVKIHPGTQYGDKFRLKNKGMKILNGGGRRGDMYVHTIVETPVKLTKKQKELLEEFDKLDGRGSSPNSEKFFKKVKSFWSDLK